MCAFAAPLSAACEWLDKWRALSAGTTISRDGIVHVWWLPDDDADQRNRKIELLAAVENDASLKDAIRTLVHAEAMARPR